MPSARQLDPLILRANDIRGTYGRDLSEEDASAIGAAFATMLRANRSPKIAVCRDGRLSSPALESALVDGLVGAGAHVSTIGLGPTPMLYFAVKRYELNGGIMVTGSHNPADMNGMKFMLGTTPVRSSLIVELAAVAAKGAYAAGHGEVNPLFVIDDYVDTLREAYGKRALVMGRSFRVAWDAGNGTAGPVIERLAPRLPGEHHLLLTDVDGHFPVHHPDPTEPKNLAHLIDCMKERDCDLGFAFDGDGDRLGVVARHGRIVWGDQMLSLFAEDVLAERPGAPIIADVKASQTLFDRIRELGGNPIMWKTGHSFIKTKMAELSAPLAGEMSGHIFFADRYYGFDDGIYTAVRFLEMAALWRQEIEARLDQLPKVFNTPELRFPCPDDRKFSVVEDIRTRLRNEGAQDVCEIDGVRVTTTDGWWLIRASNTQPALVARCEGKDADALDRLKSNLRETLARFGV